MKSTIVLGLLLASTFSPIAARAEGVPVCDRTAQVKTFLEGATKKACADITAADLALVTRVAVPGKGITAFKDGDFSGLPNLEILNIKGNPFTQLNPGLLAELPNLKTLVLFHTGLTELPEDFLANNPLIENFYAFGSTFSTLPETVWERLANYTHWKDMELDLKLDTVSAGRLTALFPASRGVTLQLD